MAIDESKISYIQQKLQNSPIMARNKCAGRDGNLLHRRLVFDDLKAIIDGFIDRSNGDDRWILMPGLRGTGKSTLLAQLYLHLTEDKGVAPVDVLFMSVDDIVEQLGSDIGDMLESYEAFTGERFESAKRPKIILLDETHFDEKWARTLKELYERAPNVFLVVTGSSALALQASPSVGADIARRTRLITVTPLRFTEFLMLKNGIVPAGLSVQIAGALLDSENADEVKAKLDSIRAAVTDYSVRFTAAEVEKYLLNGSFPFSLNLDKEESFSRIVRITKEVLRRDIPIVKKFDLETLAKFPQLVTLLAAWEDVSIEKLRGALDIKSTITVSDMVEALKKSEMIHVIPTHGGVRVSVTRPPRYALSATAIKAAFLWSVGKLIGTPDQLGKFFEDMFIQYFDVTAPRRAADIYRREGPGEADFVLQTPKGDRIACEIGYGRKDTTQLETTMTNVPCKYGLLISDNFLEVRDNIVIVPKSYLLAY